MDSDRINELEFWTSDLTCQVIVFGNEKGGSGKSTLAMHTVIGLLRAGRRVGSIDVDSRQATLTRYLENRAVFSDETGSALCQPSHRLIAVNGAGIDDSAARLLDALDSLARTSDVVVIDTPGADSVMSRLPHS